MRLIHSVLASVAAIALSAAPAVAATGKASAKAPAKALAASAKAAGGPARAQAENAMLYLKVLISGLQSDKVEEPVKAALVGCIYDNSLSKITDSMDKVIAENAGKVHRDNPSELLSVMAQICGYHPQGAPAKTPTGR